MKRKRAEWWALIPCTCADGSACYATGLVRCGPFASKGEAETCAREHGGEVVQ